MASAAFIIAVAALAIGTLALYVARTAERISRDNAGAIARHLVEHSKHEYRIPTNGKADHA